MTSVIWEGRPRTECTIIWQSRGEKMTKLTKYLICESGMTFDFHGDDMPIMVGYQLFEGKAPIRQNSKTSVVIDHQGEEIDKLRKEKQ